jgi:hypothetical protein
VTFGAWIAGHADALSSLVAPLVARLRRLEGTRLPEALQLALAVLLLLALVPLERRATWPYFVTASESRLHLLAPPRLPRAKVVIVQARDFPYARPNQGDQCWAAELPCTPEDARGLALRDPTLGLGAGFVSAR